MIAAVPIVRTEVFIEAFTVVLPNTNEVVFIMALAVVLPKLNPRVLYDAVIVEFVYAIAVVLMVELTVVLPKDTVFVVLLNTNPAVAPKAPESLNCTYVFEPPGVPDPPPDVTATYEPLACRKTLVAETSAAAGTVIVMLEVEFESFSATELATALTVELPQDVPTVEILTLAPTEMLAENVPAAVDRTDELTPVLTVELPMKRAEVLRETLAPTFAVSETLMLV